MNGYIIKATYLTGPHKGTSYFLQKGGYVTSDPDDSGQTTATKQKTSASQFAESLKAAT